MQPLSSTAVSAAAQERDEQEAAEDNGEAAGDDEANSEPAEEPAAATFYVAVNLFAIMLMLVRYNPKNPRPQPAPGSAG